MSICPLLLVKVVTEEFCCCIVWETLPNVKTAERISVDCQGPNNGEI